jgi:hypothetical protein
LQELELAVEPSKEVECLMGAIKQQMKASSPVPSAQETAARRQAMLQHMPKGTEVPPELLDLAGM